MAAGESLRPHDRHVPALPLLRQAQAELLESSRDSKGERRERPLVREGARDLPGLAGEGQAHPLLVIEPSLSVGARGRSALGGRAALVPFVQPAQSSSLATTGVVVLCRRPLKTKTRRPTVLAYATVCSQTGLRESLFSFYNVFKLNRKTPLWMCNDLGSPTCRVTVLVEDVPVRAPTRTDLSPPWQRAARWPSRRKPSARAAPAEPRRRASAVTSATFDGVSRRLELEGLLELESVGEGGRVAFLARTLEPLGGAPCTRLLGHVEHLVDAYLMREAINKSSEVISGHQWSSSCRCVPCG